MWCGPLLRLALPPPPPGAHLAAHGEVEGRQPAASWKCIHTHRHQPTTLASLVNISHTLASLVNISQTFSHGVHPCMPPHLLMHIITSSRSHYFTNVVIIIMIIRL